MIFSQFLRTQGYSIDSIPQVHAATISQLQSELENVRSEVAEQRALHSSDKEVINTFMKTVEDTNNKLIEKENLIISLRSELQDVREQFERSESSKAKEMEEMERIRATLKHECDLLRAEVDEKERKCVNLMESMEQTNKKHVDTISTLRSGHQEQCKQLEREKCDVEFLVNEKVRMLRSNYRFYLGRNFVEGGGGRNKYIS